MRFCDKLPKLRKENNITQEQLADRLGISRQAVSKWESGLSIPDMDKMIQLCNVLNCTLEDLLDDGVINSSKSENTKSSFTNYFQDFLKYISKVYNMFCSMKLREKLKCLLEMFLIFGIQYLLGLIIFTLFDSFLFRIFNYIPEFGPYLKLFFDNIIIIALIILGLIIFFHLFKIRYLDYYLLIEDQTITEKVIEPPIADQEPPQKETLKKEFIPETRKEKIIIRDPKHSTFSFFEFLSKIFLFLVKIFSTCLLAIIIAFFIFFLIIFFIALWHIGYGSIFLFLALSILGILLFTYLFIELLYNFITSLKQHLKRIFLLGILSLVIFSFGTGFAITTYLNFSDYNITEYTTVKEITIPMEDNLMLTDDSYGRLNFKYEIDDSRDNIAIKVESYGEFKIDFKEYIESCNYNNYLNGYLLFSRNPINLYKELVNNLKNKKNVPEFFNLLDDDLTVYNVTITLSNENYQKLKENRANYFIDLQKEHEKYAEE